MASAFSKTTYPMTKEPMSKQLAQEDVDLATTQDHIADRLTPNRINACVRALEIKFGRPVDRNPGRLANAVVRDAIEDLSDDTEHAIHRISKRKLDMIKHRLAEEFEPHVKAHMGWE